MLEMFSKVLPIMLMFLLGYFIKKRSIISLEGMSQIKKLVIQISLPPLLFKTFLLMDFKFEHLTITAFIIIMLSVMMLFAKFLNVFPLLKHSFNPYMSTGYAFGLMGISIFTIVYGAENLGLFSIMGLGHEIFVWFIFYTILRFDLSDSKFNLKELKGFFKSPVILGILGGLFFNILGFNKFFTNTFIGQGLLNTMSYIASLATPLILFIIGYGMQLKITYLKPTLTLLFTRFVTTLVIGSLFYFFIFKHIISITPLFINSYITFLLLPPLFSLPVFVGLYGKKQAEEEISNAIVLNTALSIIIFVIYALISA